MTRETHKQMPQFSPFDPCDLGLGLGPMPMPIPIIRAEPINPAAHAPTRLDLQPEKRPRIDPPASWTPCSDAASNDGVPSTLPVFEFPTEMASTPSNSASNYGVPSTLPLFELPFEMASIPSNSASNYGVPSTLPLFELPFEMATPVSMTIEPAARLNDPRRNKFTSNKKFPMAGMLREDGGIFGFMDKIGKAKANQALPTTESPLF